MPESAHVGTPTPTGMNWPPDLRKGLLIEPTAKPTLGVFDSLAMGGVDHTARRECSAESRSSGQRTRLLTGQRRGVRNINFRRSKQRQRADVRLPRSRESGRPNLESRLQVRHQPPIKSASVHLAPPAHRQTRETVDPGTWRRIFEHASGQRQLSKGVLKPPIPPLPKHGKCMGDLARTVVAPYASGF